MIYINEIILLLNILGTFLISIEVIKIKNLYLLLNPRIDGNGEKTEINLLNRIGFNGFLLLVIIIFSPLSYLIVSKFLKLSLLVSIFFSIGGSFVIWTILICIVKFFNIMEEKIPKGVSGLLGFLILIISFGLQYYTTLTQNCP